MTNLPPNVYRVRQRDFDAIPGGLIYDLRF